MKRSKIIVKWLSASLGTLLFISGCGTMAPSYNRPDSPAQTTWPDGSAYKGLKPDPKGQSAAATGWRDYFTSPRLQRLIELSLNNNRDLRVAALNVEKMQAQYQIKRADLFPAINGTAAATIQRTPGDLSGTGTAKISRQYSVGLGISSYEIDLFGRVRSLKDQALEQYLATAEARRAAQISLIAEVSNAWLSLGAAMEKERLAEDTFKTRRESYDLTKLLYDAGATSELTLYQTRGSMDAAEVQLATARVTTATATNALNVLVGTQIPKELLPTGLEIATAVNAPAPGSPSDLLQNRPDILQAENTLKAANANIGAARAAFFPKITLVSSLGTASAKLTDLFQPGSLAWNFAPQISVPLFDAGSNLANLDAAKIDRDIAVAQYEKAIQTAFREVADALATQGTIEDQLRAQSAVRQSAKESYRLAELRYKSGIDSYLTLLDAQRTLFTAEQDLISTRLNRASNLITLYKTLGGGLLENSATDITEPKH
jgi:multidrug efflux system outer membrane protein